MNSPLIKTIYQFNEAFEPFPRGAKEVAECLHIKEGHVRDLIRKRKSFEGTFFAYEQEFVPMPPVAY